MTERQRVYIHRFRNGTQRRIVVAIAEKGRALAHLQLEFKLDDIVASDREEFKLWSHLIRSELEGEGYRV